MRNPFQSNTFRRKFKQFLDMSEKISHVLVACLCFTMLQMLVAGCSVKEDRSLCPCRLMLDFSSLDTSLFKSIDVRAESSAGLLFFDTVSAMDFSSEYVRNVPKGFLRVSVWSGMDGEDALQIPYGVECPPLYMGVFDVDASGETCMQKVVLHKNHCRLTVRMEGRDDVPYSLTFRGKVSGYGFDGSLSGEGFCSVAYPDQEGHLHTVLPRQADSSLMMDLDDGYGFFKTFALGEYMEQSGYDWAAESLSDAEVVLDYYVTHIKISVLGWDEEYYYTVIL